jgi:hypothetical protein
MEFWRWYFRRLGSHPILKVCIWLLIVTGWMTFTLKHHQSELHDFLPLIKSPFFILSWLILIGSYVDLDYMEFKLQRGRPVPPPTLPSKSFFLRGANLFLSSLNRQKTIPAQYKELFGNDIYFRLYRLRFMFIVCFFIAGVHWMLIIKPK